MSIASKPGAATKSNAKAYQNENSEVVRSAVLETVEQLLFAPGDAHLCIDVHFKPSQDSKQRIAVASMQMTKPNNYVPATSPVKKAVVEPIAAKSVRKRVKKETSKRKEPEKKTEKEEKKATIPKERSKKVKPLRAKKHGIPTGEFYAVNQWVPEPGKTVETARELMVNEIGIREKGEAEDPTTKDASSLERIEGLKDDHSLLRDEVMEKSTSTKKPPATDTVSTKSDWGSVTSVIIPVKESNKCTQTDRLSSESLVHHIGRLELQPGPKKKMTATLTVS